MQGYSPKQPTPLPVITTRCVYFLGPATQHADTKLPRNFAFVRFVDEASVVYACRVLDGERLFGRELSVTPQRKRERGYRMMLRWVGGGGRKEGFLHAPCMSCAGLSPFLPLAHNVCVLCPLRVPPCTVPTLPAAAPVVYTHVWTTCCFTTCVLCVAPLWKSR